MRFRRCRVLYLGIQERHAIRRKTCSGFGSCTPQWSRLLPPLRLKRPPQLLCGIFPQIPTLFEQRWSIRQQAPLSRNTFGSLDQELSSRQKRHIQRSPQSINHLSLITPPPDTNPFPLPCGPSSRGTSSSGARHGEPDDAEDHRSEACGSTGP